jgi:hypothetical protein
MDAAERAFIESLIQTHRSHLQVLEQQAATFGALAPPYVVTQIAEYRQKIAELEARLRPSSAHRATGPRHNLPPRDYEQFVGRQQELAEVRRLLGPKSRAFVVTVDGIGGIGKSALALESAYIFVDQYADLLEDDRFEVIIWVSAKRTYLTADGIRTRRQVFRTIEDVFAAIARVLDYPAITRARPEAQHSIVEQALREQRTLLLLDNLETVDDEELLDFLHEVPSPTKVLVTTRHRIDVARTVRLTGMSHQDALALTAQEMIRKDVSLSQKQQEELWQRTGGVPLAIVWSIGLMSIGDSVESVLHRLGSGQSDIARFCFDESSLQIRGSDAHKLLLALSLFATDASREALGVVTGLGKDEFGRDAGLAELLRLSLVNKTGDRFGLLPLTRSFVADEATQDANWLEVATTRMQDYLFTLTREYGGWSRDYSGHDRVEREWQNIVSAMDALAASIDEQALTNGDQPLTPQVFDAARQLLDWIQSAVPTFRLRGYRAAAERLCRRAIVISQALVAATGTSEDETRYGWSCYQLSQQFSVRYDADALENLSQRVVVTAQRVAVVRMEILGLRQLSSVALLRDDLAGADRLLRESMELATQSAPGMRRHLYGSAGRVAERQGDLVAAAAWYQQAIDEFEGRQDFAAAASQLLYQGRVQLALRAEDEAYRCFSTSLAHAYKSGKIDVIAATQLYLAQIDTAHGRHAVAEENARQALELFHRLGLRSEHDEAKALLAKLTGGSQSV